MEVVITRAMAMEDTAILETTGAGMDTFSAIMAGGAISRPIAIVELRVAEAPSELAAGMVVVSAGAAVAEVVAMAAVVAEAATGKSRVIAKQI